MSESGFRFSDNVDAEVAEYRSLSGAAVAALILGLLSSAALVDPLMWFLPPLGVVVSLYAIVRIRRDAPSLIGRKAALWGLWLSLCFAAAAPADWLFYRYLVRREAKEFAAAWFEMLAKGHPEWAYQLAADPKNRHPLDDELWQFYRDNPRVWLEMDRFAAPAKEGQPPRAVRTLLALGKSARVRYDETVSQQNFDGADVLFLRYAVTFEDAGEKKTFFLLVQLLRRKTEDGRAYWRLMNCSPPKGPTEEAEELM